jgi:AcrR family transcriptional regulator
MRASSEPQRQKILAAAARKFAEDGFLGARVDDIAAAAGVNKRLLYHYVGGKSDLFVAVLRQMAEQLDSGARNDALIWALVLQEAAHAEDDVLFAALLALEFKRNPQQVRARLAQAMFGALLPERSVSDQSGIESGELMQSGGKPRLRMMPQVTAAVESSQRSSANRSK